MDKNQPIKKSFLSNGERNEIYDLSERMNKEIIGKYDAVIYEAFEKAGFKNIKPKFILKNCHVVNDVLGIRTLYCGKLRIITIYPIEVEFLHDYDPLKNTISCVTSFKYY